MATILTKKSDTSSSVPLAADLTNAAGGAELAVNTADKRLYSKTSGGSVVELGTNPSALSLPNGTANGVPYLNGSKVLTSGSALTFDGTNLGLGASTVTPIFGRTLQIGSAATENTVSLVGPTGAVFLATVGATGQLIARGGSSLVFGANDVEQMRLTSTGLGIGTSSVNYGLTLNKNGFNTTAGWYQNAVLVDASGNRGLFFGYDTSGNNVAVIGSNSNTGAASSLQFWTFNGSTWGSRLDIDSSGNLLVGTTSQFNFGKECIAFNGTSNYGLSLKDTVDQTGARFIGFISGSGTVIGAIDRVTTTNAVQYLTSSDYRLKDNVQPMVGALEKIKALKPCTYTWKEGGETDEGFIAHELQEVVPQCVSGEKDAVDAEGNPQYQGIDTSFLAATLTAAIQEQQAIITALTARVAALESK